MPSQFVVDGLKCPQVALDCAWLNEPGISFAERRQDDFGIDVVRMLAIVGCSVAEIVAITGHSLTEVLDRQSQPRSAACGKCHSEARNENENSKN